MDHPQIIKIDDVEYVQKDSQPPQTPGAIRIVILPFGWVMVGRFSQNGPNCRLDNAHVIRVWGTTEGIGQIAFYGPTKNTILDKCPPVHFHELTSIAMIDCVRSPWVSKIS